MNIRSKRLRQGVWFGLTVWLAQSAALADPPEWAGRHRRDKDGYEQRDDDAHERREMERRGYRRDEDDDHDHDEHHRGVYRYGGPAIDIRIGGYFGDAQRRFVYDHYQEQYRSGFCPPGLAKKENGCMPPGQARAWMVGQPLPAGVAYYPVEPGISVRLGLPPEGYRYVRVASDILLIAVGSSLVVDAIKDLGR